MTPAVQEAIDKSVDVEHILSNFSTNVMVSSAHAVNEQIVYIFDEQDSSLNIFVYLRPFKEFGRRLKNGLSYIFGYGAFRGDWEMFSFNKSEAERLIAFLKKVQ